MIVGWSTLQNMIDLEANNMLFILFVVWVYVSHGLICLESYLYTPNLLLVKGIMDADFVLKRPVSTLGKGFDINRL